MEVAVAVWPDGHLPASWLPTLRSLRLALGDAPIVLAGERPAGADELDVTTTAAAADVGALVATAADAWSRHVVLVTEPVVVPPGFGDLALAALDDDLRIATVSFLSNANGVLSIPHRNVPVDHHVVRGDEASITGRLRELAPAPRLAPLPLPLGPITLLSRYALAACGGVAPVGSAATARANFGLDAAGRGFVNVVDGGTYVTRATDLAVRRPEPIDDVGSADRDALVARHPFVAEAVADLAASVDAPAALAVNTAIAKTRGLRIAIDAADLGPTEMGTQVQILSLVRELAARDDVDSLQLAVPGTVPAYAEPYLGSPKIRVVAAPGGDLAAVEPADIVHRPSQPVGEADVDAWRRRAPRTVMTLQDLIAYQVGAYLGTPAAWRDYRAGLAASVGRVDGIVVISAETRRAVETEALPVGPERTFLVPNGTDHLDGAQIGSPPAGVSGEFLLVLGTNYGHKNRDLAIHAWRELRVDRPDLAIVLVGAAVPTGSTRAAEALALGAVADGVHVLADVSGGTRNWLLSNAAAVLYPTSAEGFGLVPFEAARFGTPTVAVDFGPLREVNGGVPVAAGDWSIAELVRATTSLLADDELRAAQVAATLANGAAYSWARTAAGLVDVYRRVLDLPTRATARERRVLLAEHEAAAVASRDELARATAERDSARAEVAALRASRSYRLGRSIARLCGRGEP